MSEIATEPHKPGTTLSHSGEDPTWHDIAERYRHEFPVALHGHVERILAEQGITPPRHGKIEEAHEEPEVELEAAHQDSSSEEETILEYWQSMYGPEVNEVRAEDFVKVLESAEKAYDYAVKYRGEDDGFGGRRLKAPNDAERAYLAKLERNRGVTVPLRYMPKDNLTARFLIDNEFADSLARNIGSFDHLSSAIGVDLLSQYGNEDAVVDHLDIFDCDRSLALALADKLNLGVVLDRKDKFKDVVIDSEFAMLALSRDRPARKGQNSNYSHPIFRAVLNNMNRFDVPLDGRVLHRMMQSVDEIADETNIVTPDEADKIADQFYFSKM